MNKDRSDIGCVAMTLNEGEYLVIGEDIEITFKKIGGKDYGHACMIRTCAPKNVKIERKKSSEYKSKYQAGPSKSKV